MSNAFYEDTLLKEEFRLVARLQEDPEFAKYVTVTYDDRLSGQECSVLHPPSGPRFPEKYFVQYSMPVYVGRGKLRRDWHGTATIQLSEPVLTNKHSHHGPHVTFHSECELFNNHVHQHSICSGNAWAVARDNGIWHFIISLGALINQDEFVCAEGSHFNGAAYDYWLERGRTPVTNIKWPLDLLTRVDAIKFTPKAAEASTLKIVPKTMSITEKAKSINIQLKTATTGTIRITPKKN